MEFTVASDGRISDVQGLEDILSDQDAVKAAQQWMAQFSASTSAPAAGIYPGEQWNSENPAVGLPLAGYVWRTDSTYLRDEPCRPPNPADSPRRLPPKPAR